MIDNEFYSENPPEFKRNAWYGLIFRWYGVDKIGNVAIFETGDLPIPKKVFSDELIYRKLDAFFRNLPLITNSKISEELVSRKNIAGKPIDYKYWIEEANRGMFIFDELEHIAFKRIEGYFLIAAPDVKISFNALPSDIQGFLESYRFPIIFGENKEIHINRYFDCE